MFKSSSYFIFVFLFLNLNYAFSQEAQDIETMRQSAEKGDLEAQNNLGYSYQKGEGVERDMTQAIFWYKKAAEGGYAKSQSNMANCYLAGRGVPKDTAEAIKWLQKAAKQDYAKAQYNLGTLYDKGTSTLKRDEEKAAEWYLKAAKNGFAKAMNNLAGMYMSGEGVKMDLKEAAKWAEKGAELGEPMAQAMIGQFYLEGELYGIETSRIKAHYYLSRAVAAGLPMIDTFLQKALPQNKVEMVAKMSDELCQDLSALMEEDPDQGSSSHLTALAKRLFDEDNDDFQQLIKFAPKENKTDLKKNVLIETINTCPVFRDKDASVKQKTLAGVNDMVKEISVISSSTECDSSFFMEAIELHRQGRYDAAIKKYSQQILKPYKINSLKV